MDKLVSIITPCYNGEKYIDRYAKALLEQDYDNCQLIFMDDGSGDASKEKIFSYEKSFLEKGFKLEYHFHENIGLGATIAEAVHYIKGDYVVWPDVDDTLAPHSISKKVEFLEENPQFGVVRTDFNRIYDDNPDVVVERGAQRYANRWKEDLFEDYLLSNQIWLQPGCFMIRMSAFLDSNPNRYIFPTRRGQDWQMLLPVFYKYKCGYIDEPLYNYFLRKGSLSDASKEIPAVAMKKYEMYEDLILDTLDHIDMPAGERERYKKMVNCRYLQIKIDVCFKNGMRSEAKKIYCQLKRMEKVDIKYKIKVLITGTILSSIYQQGRK